MKTTQSKETAQKHPKNVVIAQSGGPSMVINTSLVGCIVEMRDPKNEGIFGKVYGARHGIAGILERKYVDLNKVPESKLPKLASTPSSALGSCRLKPTANDCRMIFEEFQRLKVGYFFYIGGNDSADAARIVAEEAERAHYPLVVYHIPKTIDNDLRNCDHTPGFASAAKFVAHAFKGDDLDNRALGGVKINVVMGRDAGFLTAASALARENPGDGPHLIYMPERPFSLDGFVKDVKDVMKQQQRCVVAISEGIRDKNGFSIGAQFAGGERDSHGNVQMSGTGALGDYLAKYLKDHSGIKRVRADTFGYLQRSFPCMQTETDFKEAFFVGASAVDYAIKAAKNPTKTPAMGTIAICRKKTKKYSVEFVAQPIENAAKLTRSMPDEFIAKNGHDVTQAFLDYATPLVGRLAHCELL